MIVHSLVPHQRQYRQDSIASVLGCITVSTCLLAVFTATSAQAQSQLTPAADETGSVVTQQGSRFDITAGSHSANGANLFHSFEEFSVGTGDHATFVTTPTVQNILTRVTGENASVIDGHLQVQGSSANLFFMNPSGILIGPNAQLNLPASVTLTTADAIEFDDHTFHTTGHHRYDEFGQPPTGEFSFDNATGASIINQGTITAGPQSALTLIGEHIVNTGTLETSGGTITAAAVPGKSRVQISRPDALLSFEVFHSAQAHASSLVHNPDGSVSLLNAPSYPSAPIGNTSISGHLDVEGETGGTIALLGEHVALTNADLSASGTHGGGNIYIGGAYQGAETLLAAEQTFIDANTSISADALETNHGGQVVVWANDTTQYLGDISVNGGRINGNGGLVEVSGKESLFFQGRVDTQANQGEVGSLLLDPRNIFITDRAPGADDDQLSDHEILAGDGNGVLEISTTALESLSASSNITLQATNNIVFGNLGSNQLTFAAGSGNITFTADADNNNIGSVVFRDADDVIFAPGRDLVISGHSLSLGSLSTAASTGGGDITLIATDKIVARDLDAHSTDSAAGNISLTAVDSVDIHTIRTESPTRPGDVNVTSQTADITVDFLFPEISLPETSENMSFSSPGNVMINGVLLSEETSEETDPTPEQPNDEPPAEELPEEPEEEPSTPGPSQQNNDETVSEQALVSQLSTLSASSSSLQTSTTEASSDAKHTVQRTELSSQEASEALSAMDTDSHRLFSDYFGRDLDTAEMNLENVQTLLANIEQDSNHRSAVVYVQAPVADDSSPSPNNNSSSNNDSPLELLLFTAEAAPVKISIPAVEPAQLFNTIQTLRADLITSARRGGDYYLPASEQLHSWIVGPIQAELETAEIDTLVFAMDEGLRGIPLAALHDGESFLIEQYSLGIVPSLGMLQTQYSSLASADVLAMGMSDFSQHDSLNALPAVPNELQAIQAHWPGAGFLNEQFTKQNLISQRQQNPYEIVHLATHAQFQTGGVENSYIQLWDKKLRLNELDQLGWQSPAVELLVLSACNTASGSAEAEMGFAGLAIAAGVDSALASLWSVDDAGTLAFMDEFYAQLRTSSTKSAALQQAQLALLNRVDSTRIENTQDFAHPYYWSGFTMIGSPW